MINKLKILAVCLLVTAGAFAQSAISYEGETINRIDKDGKKYGIWKLSDKERGVSIVGKMENDAFVSNIDYYYHDNLVVTLNHKTKGYTFYKDLNGTPVTIQKKEGKTVVVKDNGEELGEADTKTFFRVLEMRPMFYGGDKVMRNFLRSEIKKRAWDFSGKVKLSWLVDENGFVKDVKIVTSNNDFLDEDLIRLVEKMPRWQPGFQNGRFVRARFSTALSLKVFRDEYVDDDG